VRQLNSGIVFGLTFVLACLTLNVVAQDCTNVEFALFNITEGEIPQLNVAYEFSDFDGVVVQTGLWEVTDSGVFAPMCLPMGCYLFFI
jgi:hypothetical protein